MAISKLMFLHHLAHLNLNLLLIINGNAHLNMKQSLETGYLIINSPSHNNIILRIGNNGWSNIKTKDVRINVMFLT